MTAVLILLGPLDYPCPHRIQMDVPDEFAEIAIGLTEDRFVAPLKHVADLFVLAIVILAVAGQHSLHDSAKGIVLHLDQEMDVIRHQAVGVEIEWQLGFLVLKDAGESEVVIVRAKDLAAIIATRDDVIEPSSD